MKLFNFVWKTGLFYRPHLLKADSDRQDQNVRKILKAVTSSGTASTNPMTIGNLPSTTYHFLKSNDVKYLLHKKVVWNRSPILLV
jgi:hypothetical protein